MGEQIAFNETVEVCRTPLVKDCNIVGPEICRTEYESECWTKQEVHDVEDDVVECRTEYEEKCIDKVEMIEETEYDNVVQCDHSYDKRCHTTYVTNYESQQEEDCEENYRKNCFIEYEQIAFNETV